MPYGPLVHAPVIAAFLLLWVGVPALVLVLLYWVIRKAVAAGIKDARVREQGALEQNRDAVGRTGR
jgi:hypothetical protein